MTQYGMRLALRCILRLRRRRKNPSDCI
jgi:hypothetical protein